MRVKKGEGKKGREEALCTIASINHPKVQTSNFYFIRDLNKRLFYRYILLKLKCAVTPKQRRNNQTFLCRFFANHEIQVKLQLHDAIYRLRFYWNSLIHILSLSNSHNNLAWIQKNRRDKSHRVIVALDHKLFSLKKKHATCSTIQQHKLHVQFHKYPTKARQREQI